VAQGSRGFLYSSRAGTTTVQCCSFFIFATASRQPANAALLGNTNTAAVGPFMRILAVSDIHSNMSCVNKLRAVESNRFDVAVVAGDMGNAIAQPLLRTLSTFDCPVIYVYGNWDYELEYSAEFTPTARLLHLEPIRVGELIFAGFSGCETHWGRNPIALRANEEVDDQHREIVRALRDAEKNYQCVERAIGAAHEQKLLELQRKTKDQQCSTYRDRIAALERQYERDTARAYKPVDRLKRSRAFRAYQKDALAADSDILPQNRSAMIKYLADSSIDPGSVILVTHQRFAHINEFCPGTFMHLYGHLHGFKHSIFKGTHCVNVSVLDKLQGLLPKTMQDGHQDEIRNANAGTYTVIEISRGGTTVQSKQLPVEYPSWAPAPFPVMGNPLVPDETRFGTYRVSKM
jgi:Calcineurin-like phosphoesterase superfamily domain